MSTINDVERSLLESAENASIDDLGKIAAAMKSISEAKQSELMALHKRREIRLEFFKSVATFLVPIVSLIALFSTVIIQNRQVDAGRQQIEGTEWRDLLNSLKGASETVYSDPTVAPRLRSFFASPIYGDQAKSIAERLMGHISNSDGFTELFYAVFGEPTPNNIVSIIDIGRALLVVRQSVERQCNTLLSNAKLPLNSGLGDCSDHLDNQKALDLIGATDNIPANFVSMRQSAFQILFESRFLSAKIARFLRANYHIPRNNQKPPALDLSGLYISQVDLSQVDLSDFNIAGTIFETVNFKGAIIDLKDPTDNGIVVDRPQFLLSSWWDARHIEPHLLSFLIGSAFPRQIPDKQGQVYSRINSEDYQAKVKMLCVEAKLSCPSVLKFEAS